MADTYTLISSVTVGAGGASSIDFTSIPATYTDLLLKVSARDGRADYTDDFKITINGNTSVTYANRRLSGFGSSVSSDGGSATGLSYAYSGVLTASTATANTFGNSEFYFPNYGGTTAKSWSVDGVSENNATSAQAALYANYANITTAITSIKLEGYNSGTLSQYSTAYLYGIKNS